MIGAGVGPMYQATQGAGSWWPANRNIAYDLEMGRYMRNGLATFEIDSLIETRASDAYPQTSDAYVQVAATELAIGRGVGLQSSAAVTNLFLNPTLQGHTSWIAGGDGDLDLTANAGLDPLGAQVATVVENQNDHNFGSQLYQGVAIVDTEMTVSMWAYASEDVLGSLKLNDNENNLNITIGTTMQRFDHTGTIGPALLGGGIGRCGFACGEDWRGKGVVIAWIQINVGGPAPFAVGTRAADNPIIVQGAGADMVTGDPDDFTGASELDGAVLTADQLGTADLVDLSANVNARVSFSPDVTLVVGTQYRIGLALRSVTGEGWWPIACYNGISVVDAHLVYITEEWSTHYVYMTPFGAGTPGHYLGNRRNVEGETIFQAYAKGLSVKKVTPWEGYDKTGVLSGDELITGGDVTGWDISSADNVAFVDGGVQLDSNPDNGEPNVSGLFSGVRAGAVLALGLTVTTNALTNFPRASVGGSSTAPYIIGATAFTPTIGAPLVGHFIASDSSPRVYVKMSGTRASGSLLALNGFTMQEVKPGIVLETTALYGDAVGLHAFRFDDTSGDDIVLVQRTGTGTVKLLVRRNGSDLINFASATAWPDNVVATFRLEITGTDSGTFFALFLNDVYIADIPSDPVAYPEAVAQLKLAAVVGEATIKQVYAK